ncbi:MAG: hypothetical protein LUB83_00100 [Prevotellaceae bacterium]|nr:hypothetical protein [Prevotellaceae bacterium]
MMTKDDIKEFEKLVDACKDAAMRTYPDSELYCASMRLCGFIDNRYIVDELKKCIAYDDTPIFKNMPNGASNGCVAKAITYEGEEQ